jgi:nucleobase:cation symporter-1, NCS1 family
LLAIFFESNMMMREGGTERVVEKRAIHYIPESERSGHPWHLFTLWCASNCGITPVITGAVAVYIGMNLFWAIASVVVGNAIGGVFMAYHSVQGPRMGLPQMVQSRAQFGSAGAILPIGITLLVYLGFQIEGTVATGDALAARTGLTFAESVVIFGLFAIITAIFGYRIIHLFSKAVTVIIGSTFAAFFIELLTKPGLTLTPGRPHWSEFLLAVSVSVSWQVTWAPYVSDYSRYLPSNTPASRTFWCTYSASVLTSSATMTIGVLAAIAGGHAFDSDPLNYLTNLLGAGGGAFFWLLFLGGFGGASGPYGAFLTAYAGVTRRNVENDKVALTRACFVVGFIGVATVASVLAKGHVLSTFENVTGFLLYLIVPWTAINLVDYFLVRHGQYNGSELFERRGIYGFVNWRSVGIYLVGVGVQIPFINSPLYEGRLATSMNGADIAWILGLAFSGIVYYVTARHDPDVAPLVSSAASSL